VRETPLLLPPSRYTSDDGPPLAGFHHHGVSSAIHPANRILGQHAAQIVAFLAEPTQAFLFQQTEAVLCQHQLTTIEGIDQTVQRIIAQYVKPRVCEVRR
jgi:hypothetical protein